MSPSVEASLAIALITFLAVEGNLKLRLRGQYTQDLDHMRNIVDLYDKRYMDLWKDSEELRRLTLDNRNISAYVPPLLLSRLRGQREQVPRLGGTKREVTIVFTDTRGYSTFSEHLDPSQTLQMLNDASRLGMYNMFSFMSIFRVWCTFVHLTKNDLYCHTQGEGCTKPRRHRARVPGIWHARTITQTIQPKLSSVSRPWQLEDAPSWDFAEAYTRARLLPETWEAQCR